MVKVRALAAIGSNSGTTQPARKNPEATKAQTKTPTAKAIDEATASTDIVTSAMARTSAPVRAA